MQQLIVHNEQLGSELTASRKRETERLKQETEERDELRRACDAKIKQATCELIKQTACNKQLRVDLDKLGDKLRLGEEKLAHVERDVAQKKQLVDFYKKKLSEMQHAEVAESTIESSGDSNEQQLRAQCKRLSESLDKQRNETRCVRARLDAALVEKRGGEARCALLEKSVAEESTRLEAARRDKCRLEHQLKQYKAKSDELEACVASVEAMADAKVRSLAAHNEQTLAHTQAKLAHACRSLDSYERLIKCLYESLVKKWIELRRELNVLAHTKKQQPPPPPPPQPQPQAAQSQTQTRQTAKDNEAMKMAIELASSVLNMTSTELDELISVSSENNHNNNNNNNNNNNINNHSTQSPKRRDDALSLCCVETADTTDTATQFIMQQHNDEKLCKLLIFEFDQHLQQGSGGDIKIQHQSQQQQQQRFNGMTTKEEKIGGGGGGGEHELNMNICNLISSRLNDVLSYERELTLLKNTR